MVRQGEGWAFVVVEGLALTRQQLPLFSHMENDDFETSSNVKLYEERRMWRARRRRVVDKVQST